MLVVLHVARLCRVEQDAVGPLDRRQPELFLDQASRQFGHEQEPYEAVRRERMRVRAREGLDRLWTEEDLVQLQFKDGSTAIAKAASEYRNGSTKETHGEVEGKWQVEGYRRSVTQSDPTFRARPCRYVVLEKGTH